MICDGKQGVCVEIYLGWGPHQMYLVLVDDVPLKFRCKGLPRSSTWLIAPHVFQDPFGDSQFYLGTCKKSSWGKGSKMNDGKGTLGLK